MQMNRAVLESPEQINLEVHRRALAIAQATLEVGIGEDPYTIASRQVFHELLKRIAEEQRPA